MTDSALNRLKVLPQYCVPQHLLSRAVGLLAESRWPLIKNTFIQFFLRRYGIDMSLAAEENPTAYATFNDFFTRALKDGVRPITEHGIACPADGSISQLGAIDDDRIFQAKGHHYTLNQLLGGDEEMAARFRHGQFATVYLSPRDYHRVHMPLAGKLTHMTYVPGKLFSVNNLTAGQVPALFARNERVVAYFDTELGPMAVVLVGAMVVASIETVWEGLVTPPKRTLKHFDYAPRDRRIELGKGEEMGRFKVGSTAIVLFGPGKMQWNDALQAGSRVCMGEQLGKPLPSESSTGR
ncbi:MAG: phosphatidylserine decarboxylase [Pseudomonadales bacterium]|jgi:phosphatidylserine decarboxylase|uniref:archaetidylserine decarboxylase n=1 Tax=unclassified Ketobacter TaxID=2639109 RepID=UPI000C952E2F|nr:MULTISPECIES: archaetidylserine decarboxylase [unclassified Ketobacter]MAA59796.1 phosphatidylserine decarboxylase [Pseudomonadales bacterium]MEC8813892.1 archaetidylserine decarboxylase [Pseudomonadota bacterium]TNC90905.1 MAG: phosphatidylserine decarboxylase [Alcanivorax sp.]HAG94776.1 phosphatidylserine decarboxylase [Gammaproteobacteria bacterium]MAQ24044.1 phosphatidylserine decarboxylase [Pseudomonadales bacterium]|tara:strand:- start:623 stop:1507 length:885 start_codon:yes stop_codon:yes gene_type:complete